MRKIFSFFIVNMAMSDLLYSGFAFPWALTELNAGSRLISGIFGHTLCKMISFATVVSLAVSIQSLVLIAVDRFGAVVFPLRSPLIGSKLCPFLILATWPSCGIVHYWLVGQIIASANCAINPCICFFFSGNYRQGLKNLLETLFCRIFKVKAKFAIPS